MQLCQEICFFASQSSQVVQGILNDSGKILGDCSALVLRCNTLAIRGSPRLPLAFLSRLSETCEEPHNKKQVGQVSSRRPSVCRPPRRHTRWNMCNAEAERPGCQASPASHSMVQMLQHKIIACVSWAIAGPRGDMSRWGDEILR